MAVPNLLNEAQRGSSGSQLRCARSMWQVVAEAPERAASDLDHAFRIIMTMPERSMYVDRLLRFLTVFASEATDDDRLSFLEDQLTALCPLGGVADNGARWRAVQLTHSLLVGMPTDAGLSEDLAEDLVTLFLARVREDPKPAVRAVAARALARLADPGDEGTFADCDVTSALIDCVRGDGSRDVRKAALVSLPACSRTLALLMEHTLDLDDEMRRVVYLTLADTVHVGTLGVDERCRLLQRGLRDRVDSVVDAATALLGIWSASVGHDLFKLASLLSSDEGEGAEDPDAEAGHGASYSETIELAVSVLLKQSGGPSAAELLGEWTEAGDTLKARCEHVDKTSAVVELSPSKACVWRIVCEHAMAAASDSGTAAASGLGAVARIRAADAGGHLEALEAFLPPGWADACELLQGILFLGPDDVAVHATADQLLLLCARCLDTDDAEGRRRAARLTLEVLESVAAQDARECSGARREAIETLLRNASSGAHELGARALDLLVRLSSQGQEDDCSTAALSTGHMLALAMALASLPARLEVAGLDVVDAVRAAWHAIILPELEKEDEETTADQRVAALRCAGTTLGTWGPAKIDGASIAAVARHLAPGSRSSSPSWAKVAAACVALSDAALRHGVQAVDLALAAAGHEPLLPGAAAALGAWRHALRTTAGRGDASLLAEHDASGLQMLEALGRLMVHEAAPGGAGFTDSAAVVEAAAELLVLAFDPATEAACRFRQGMTVLFEVLAGESFEAQAVLSAALLPAARRTAAEDVACGRGAADATAPRLLRFAARLLGSPVWTLAGAGPAQAGHATLALASAREICATARCGARGPLARAYVCALGGLCATLPLGEPDGVAAGAETRPRSEVCAATEALEGIVEAVRGSVGLTAARVVVAAAERLRGAAPAATAEGGRGGQDPSGPLRGDPAPTDALTVDIDAHERLLSAVPFPFDAGKALARGRVSTRAPARDPPEDDEEGEQTDAEEVVVPRRAPARRRAAPVKSYTVDEDDDESTSESGEENEASPFHTGKAAPGVDGLRRAFAENRFAQGAAD